MGKNGAGKPFKRKFCESCHKKTTGNMSRAKNKIFCKDYKKLDYCEVCGIRYEPHVLCEDHIDGDQTNAHIDNFMTVCHNCHAGKSHAERLIRNLAHTRNKLYETQNALYRLKKKLARIEGIRISEVEIE
jgi:hypothetical protein